MIDLRLSAPAKNALGSELMQEIRERLRAANGSPVLMLGDGGAFSAGLNLKEVASLDENGMLGFLGLLEDMVLDLFNYPGPLVACVNGHAIAGGCVLALCADHRVAAAEPKIRIGLNEVAIGVRYPPRVMALCRARLPRNSLERVVLGAGLHSPAEALALGLVDELSEDPEATARARLAELAKHPADAYTAGKRGLREGVLGPSPEEWARFQREDLPAWLSDELKVRIGKLLGR
jgi:enoyl-CoA hydratase/carnithine racemase